MLLEKQDGILTKIKSEVLKERELYYSVGVGFITKNLDERIFRKWIALIEQNKDRYRVENGELHIRENLKFIDKIRSIRKE
ncbi:hypothetical protein QR510_29020, partial [Escherichia coli]|uniref:hypothetical protein n=1 Tax=Escherichia coli TaxID=562 RepID=UPI00273876B8